MTKIIAIEGPTNSGKTTLYRRIVEEVRSRGWTVADISEKVKANEVSKRLKKVTGPTYKYGEMDAISELLLYCGHLSLKSIYAVKALSEKNDYIFLDRYSLSLVSFFSSVRGLDPRFVAGITSAAARNITPDMTIYIDVDINVILQRATVSPLSRKDKDIEEYWSKLRETNLHNLSHWSKNSLVIDGSICSEVLLTQATEWILDGQRY